MFKFISSAVLASSFALASAQDASTYGGGRCGGGRACTVPTAAACDAQPAASAAPAAQPNMPDRAPKAPATAQNTTQRYRSYSYDTAPAASARQMQSSGRRSSSFYDQNRADRKMRGLQ